MDDKELIKRKRVITPKFRISYPNLDKPRAYQEGAEPKFSVTMLFPKNVDITVLKEAAEAARIERWGTDKTKWPKKKTKSGKLISALRSPFRDGDLEKSDSEGYPDHIFVSASAKADKQPGMVDHLRKRIEPKDIKAGYYAKAELIAFAYPMEGQKSKGNMGVSFSLQNIQLVGKGKTFGGRKDAETVFEEVEEESDLPENYEEESEVEEESEAEESTDEDDLGF